VRYEAFLPENMCCKLTTDTGMWISICHLYFQRRIFVFKLAQVEISLVAWVSNLRINGRFFLPVGELQTVSVIYFTLREIPFYMFRRVGAGLLVRIRVYSS